RFFGPEKGATRSPAKSSRQRRTRFFRLPGKKFGELLIRELMNLSNRPRPLSSLCNAIGLAAGPTAWLPFPGTVRIHNGGRFASPRMDRTYRASGPFQNPEPRSAVLVDVEHGDLLGQIETQRFPRNREMPVTQSEKSAERQNGIGNPLVPGP